MSDAEARPRAWIERQLKNMPPPTWDQWVAANTTLGITVRRKEAA